MKNLIFVCLLLNTTFGLIAQNNRIELKGLNTDAVEYAPSISADGNTMVFQSNRNGEYQLFESFKNENGNWSKPILLEGGINEFGAENDLIGGPSITYDGNQIFFFASYKGGLGSEDIYYSNREGHKWGKPINIGAPINSKGYEGFPSISSDGKSIYFIRLNRNIINKLNCYTMLVSHKNEAGKWGRPITLPRPLNLGCEKFPRIMPDNETLIFSSLRTGSIGSSFDLYETKLKEGNKWTTPKPLTFANTPEQDYFATVSSRADLMYLNVKGALDYDFFSFDIPTEFKPKKVVNIQGTIFNEKGLPLHSDIHVFNQETGKEIIFIESNESDGSYTIVIPEGQYDLNVIKEGFITYKEDLNIEAVDEYHLFQKNIALSSFKTKIKFKTHNDLSKKSIEAKSIILDSIDNITLSLNEGFFLAEYAKVYNITSELEGFESVESRIEIINTETLEQTKRVYLKPLKPQIKISPIDSETKKPIAITLFLKNLSKKSYAYRGKLNNDTLLTLDFKSIYTVYATNQKYLFSKDVINFSKQKEYTYLDYQLELTRIKPGAKLTLKDVYFKSGSTELEASSNKELAAVYGFLRSHKNLVMEISAHTDNVGSEHDNLKLSNGRAKSVVDYLIAKGISPSNIIGKGYGESKPAVSNRTEVGKSKNRRVEFKVLEVN